MKYFPLLILLLTTTLDEDVYYFQDFVKRVETEYSLPRGILRSIAQVESKFKPSRITRNDGPGRHTSYGLLQIQEPSARQVGFKGKPKELLIPETNIYYGAKYLTWLIIKTKGDVPSALNCWNAGINSQICKNKMNRKYSDKVLDSYMRNKL